MALLGCKENAKKLFQHAEFNRHPGDGDLIIELRYVFIYFLGG